MFKFLILKALLLLFISFFISNTLHANEKTDLVNRVKNLGKSDGYETDTNKQAEDFYIFSRYQKSTVDLLLKELRPIKKSILLTSSADKHTEDLHVVWCIRALRFFTGCKFFTEKTKDRFTIKDQTGVMLLSQKKQNEYSFFAVSASKDKIYIAPIYAQKAIIKKWNGWFKQNGEGFKYSNCPDVTIWCY